MQPFAARGRSPTQPTPPPWRPAAQEEPDDDLASADARRTRARRRRAIADGGGADKLAARHAKGQLGARERLDRLFQPGTFQETGMHVRPRRRTTSGCRTRPSRPTASSPAPATIDGQLVGRLQPGLHRQRRHAGQGARARRSSS
ncbi:MAG: hypothetical protein MZW92_73475 [Comamonadaceae bacterium]|nr:hypothetical protein [Comamonadaceae bacterium]